jgi:hypothetical protein
MKIRNPARILLYALLSAGAALRLGQYLFNRSLWLDEAVLALYIIGHSFAGLFSHIPTDPAAPVGFTLAVKLIGLLGNYGEYSLRLLPLICGIITLPAIYIFTKRHISGTAALIALSLAIFSNNLIYYSSELKPYACDIPVALAIYMAAIRYKPGDIRSSLLFAATGAVCVWMSLPAVFVLAGCTAVLLLSEIERKEKPAALIAALAWGLSFLVNYLTALKPIATDQLLQVYWRQSFAPLSPAFLKQIIPQTMSFMFHPGVNIAGILLIACGTVSMMRDHRKIAFMLWSPALFMAIAAMLGKYPLTPRLMIFLFPAMAITIAQGLIWITGRFKRPLALILCTCVFLAPEAADSAYYFLNPRQREEIRPVMQFIKDRAGPEDTIYVFHAALPQFEYYRRSIPLPGNIIMEGKPYGLTEDALEEEFAPVISSKRAWIVFSHMYPTAQADVERTTVSHLEKTGRILAKLEAERASAYFMGF